MQILSVIFMFTTMQGQKSHICIEDSEKLTFFYFLLDFCRVLPIDTVCIAYLSKRPSWLTRLFFMDGNRQLVCEGKRCGSWLPMNDLIVRQRVQHISRGSFVIFRTFWVALFNALAIWITSPKRLMVHSSIQSQLCGFISCNRFWKPSSIQFMCTATSNCSCGSYHSLSHRPDMMSSRALPLRYS